MSKVALEVAQAEVNKWLDYKKVSQEKRETYQNYISALVSGVQEGILSIDEENVITQKLIWPIKHQEGKGALESLSFRPRITVGAIHNHMNGVKADDADGRIKAYICALTNTPKALINALDTDDYGIPQAVAVFFF